MVERQALTLEVLIMWFQAFWHQIYPNSYKSSEISFLFKYSETLHHLFYRLEKIFKGHSIPAVFVKCLIIWNNDCVANARGLVCFVYKNFWRFIIKFLSLSGAKYTILNMPKNREEPMKLLLNVQSEKKRGSILIMKADITFKK